MSDARPIDERESPIIYPDLAAWAAARRGVGESAAAYRAGLARRTARHTREYEIRLAGPRVPVPPEVTDAIWNANRAREQHARYLKGFKPGR